MILRSSGASPFGRKAKMVAKIVGLYDQITVKDSNTQDPNDSLRIENPLGKIPILILDDDTSIYDSRVICEYLADYTKDTTLFPSDSASRWEALTLQALADGIMDAAILQVYESRMRPEEKRFDDWLSYQSEKVSRALTQLEAAPPSFEKAVTIGHVTLACALSYLDLRFEGKWRETFPQLVAWLEKFRTTVPAFDATQPVL